MLAALKAIKNLTPDTQLKLGIACIILAFDIFIYQRYYPKQHDFNTAGLIITHGFVLLLIVLVVIYDRSKGIYLVYHNIAMAFLLSAPMVIFCLVAPATPYAPIDALLKQLDNYVGYHAPTIFLFTQAHPLFKLILETFYSLLFFELYFFVFMLSCLGDRIAVRKFLFSMALCYVAAAFFYFFFPSLAPAYLYPHTAFTASQKQVVTQFFMLKHHQHLYFHNLAIIAFPSFHAIWALLILYYAKHRKILFSVLLPCNVILLFSTLTTGWHYLADIFGAFLFASVAILLTSIIFSWQNNGPQTDTPIWSNTANPQKLSVSFQLISLAVLFLSVYCFSPVMLLVYSLFVLFHFNLWSRPEKQL
jgi:hypothetical protein